MRYQVSGLSLLERRNPRFYDGGFAVYDGSVVI